MRSIEGYVFDANSPLRFSRSKMETRAAFQTTSRGFSEATPPKREQLDHSTCPAPCLEQEAWQLCDKHVQHCCLRAHVIQARIAQVHIVSSLKGTRGNGQQSDKTTASARPTWAAGITRLPPLASTGPQLETRMNKQMPEPCSPHSRSLCLVSLSHTPCNRTPSLTHRKPAALQCLLAQHKDPVWSVHSVQVTPACACNYLTAMQLYFPI